GNSVADRKHRSDLGEVGLDVVLLDPLTEDRRDLFRAQLQVSLSSSRVSVAIVPTCRARLRRPGTNPPAARRRRSGPDRRFVSLQPCVPPPFRSARRSLLPRHPSNLAPS